MISLKNPITRETKHEYSLMNSTSELNYIEFFREINFTNKLFKLHWFFSEFDDPDSGLVSLTGFPPTEERSRPDGAEEDEPDQRYVIFFVRLCLD